MIILTLHWWMLPLAITVLSIAYSFWRTSREPRGGDYGFGKEIVFITTLPLAVILSLIAWLLWALLA